MEVPSGDATNRVSSKSTSVADAETTLAVPGGRMKTSTCDPSPVNSSASGTPERVGESQLGCSRFDQFEQFARVLGSGEVDANARMVTAEPADEGRRGVGGEGRKAHQGQDA